MQLAFAQPKRQRSVLSSGCIKNYQWLTFFEKKKEKSTILKRKRFFKSLSQSMKIKVNDISPKYGANNDVLKATEKFL